MDFFLPISNFSVMILKTLFNSVGNRIEFGRSSKNVPVSKKFKFNFNFSSNIAFLSIRVKETSRKTIRR